MPTFIGIRQFIFLSIAAAMAVIFQLPSPALAQHFSDFADAQASASQASNAFQLVGTYTGIGGLLASVVGPGPTPGSQRLYASYAYSGNTFDILSIDPETGNTTVIHNPVAGESVVWSMTVGPDGNVYLGTLPHAHFLKLDTQLGTLVDLGRPSPTESYIWSVTFGSDNRLYGGTYPGCKLVRYDPATGQLADLGTMDPTQEDARFVAASKDGIIYVGVGPANANFSAFQIATGKHAEILPPAQQAVAFSKVFVGTEGNVYGSVNGLEYALSGFAATPLSPSNGVPAAPTNALSDGRIVSINETQSASGSEVLNLVVTNSATGMTDEYLIAYQGEQMPLMSIGFGPDGVLYGSSAIPANLFRTDMSQKSLIQIGVVGAGEVYSFLNHGDDLLMGAYSGLATFMSYQPGVPFKQGGGATNPDLVNFKGDNGSWRPEAMINGPDGNVYAGAVAGYGLIESPLIQWNSASGSVQLFNVVPNQSVVSLATWQNFIVGGTSSSGGPGSHPINADAQLFMWNPSTQEVEFQIAPVAGAATITDLIAAPNGLVYGIANNTLFEFNPETQQITNSQTLPFSNFIYNSVSFDNAGRIWGLAESGIFVVDTSTFNATLIASSPLQITGGFAISNGNIYFISGPSIYSYTIPLATAAVSVSPAQTALSLNVALDLTVTVSGGGAVPVGSVTLSGGGYTSQAGTLSGGSYTFTIPANSLSPGADTLTISYSGDTNYAPTAGTTILTVTAPAFTLAASAPSAPAPGSSATSSVTITGVGGYAGTVILTCALTLAPTDATDLPTCSANNSTVTLNSGATIGTTNITVNMPSTSAAQVRSAFNKSRRCFGASDGAVLAFLMCLGIPARRRNWRSMVSILVAMVALGSMTGCDSTVVGGSGPTGINNPGTAASDYTFTVTGTGTPLVSPAPSTTFTFTVN